MQLTLALRFTRIKEDNPLDSRLSKERNLKFEIEYRLLISTNHKIVAGG